MVQSLHSVEEYNWKMVKLDPDLLVPLSGSQRVRHDLMTKQQQQIRIH